MLSRRSAAGLSLNKMLDSEDQGDVSSPPLPPVSRQPMQMMQVAMPSMVRVKPVLDTPIADTMMQPSMPRIMARPTIDQQPSHNQFSLSNVVQPSISLKPRFEAPISQMSQMAPSSMMISNPLDISQQEITIQQPKIPKRAPKPRPQKEPTELLASLKEWSKQMTKASDVELENRSNPGMENGSLSMAKDLLPMGGLGTTFHASGIPCVLSSTQISNQLKSLQSLLDLGFIQPSEFERRRFELQSMTKHAIPEISVPHFDANAVMSPMTSTSSDSTGSVNSEMKSRNIRIFVSSTFKDMAEEREVLVKFVFPKVQQECRKRGIYFTSVDLRWGITSEQTNAGNTVNICLSEIDRSQYFLGILGSRYGWAQPIDVPPVSLDSALTAQGQDALLKKSMQQAMRGYPWIRSYANCSVTELEIRHAFLNNSDSPLARRSTFMIKNTTDDDPRLTSLKQEISGSTSRPGSIGKYSKPTNQDFGPMVLQQILSMICADFPERLEPLTPHDAFEELKCRFFVGRESDLQTIDSHLTSNTTRPIIICAEQGMGKSSLLANWTSRFRKSHPERLVLAHYVGCSSASLDLSATLSRLIELLWKHSKTDEEKIEMPNSLNELQDKFIELLTASGSRYGGGVTLIVDSLNDLSSGTTLEWLPPQLPSGVQLVVSTSSKSDLAHIKARMNAAFHELKPLLPLERESFVKAFMGMYGKSLTDEQVTKLAAPNACSNPLFLKTLLEELRLFGSFEQLDSQMASYVSSKTPVELYKLVFARMESDIASSTSSLSSSSGGKGNLTSRSLLSSVLTNICVSRCGLTSEELISILKINPSTWSQISLVIEDLVIETDGLLNLSHGCVRQAVLETYLSSSKDTIHVSLASFFKSFYDLSSSNSSHEQEFEERRKYQELPYHLMMSKDFNGLMELITSLQGFKVLESLAFRNDLYQYWRSLPSSLSSQRAIESIMKSVQSTSLEGSEKASMLFKAGLFFKDLGLYPAAEEALKKSCLVNSSKLSLDIDTSSASSQVINQLSNNALSKNQVSEIKTVTDRLEQLGYVLRLAGKYGDASKVYRAALAGKRSIANGMDSQSLAASINGLAVLCRKQGKYDEASSLYHEALDMRKRLFGNVHLDVAQSYNSLGCLLQDQGQYENASVMLKEAIHQREMLLGKMHPDVAMSSLNLGNVYLDWSRYQDSEPCLERALKIYEITFGPDHPNFALVLNSLGGLYQEMGRFDLALPAYIRNLETKIKLLGHFHPDLALAFNDIAVLCSRRDNNELAEDFFNGAIKIRKEVLGEKHPDYAQSLQNLGSIYQQNGWYDLALPLFKQSLDINQASFGESHPNVASACTSIGGLLQLKGSSFFDKAVNYYLKAITIYTKLSANTNKPDSDLALTCNDLAILYVKLSRWSDAESMYLEALKHYTGCFGPDHSDVAQALKNLGGFYANPARLDKEKAIKYYQESIQTFTKCLGESHSRTQAVKSLLDSIRKI